MALEFEKLREALREHEREMSDSTAMVVVQAARHLASAVGDPDRRRNYRVTVEIDVLARFEAEAAEIGFGDILTLTSPVVTVVPLAGPTSQWERDPEDLDWRRYEP